MATTARKNRIMEHLARTSGDFFQPVPRNSEQRKQQIMEHIRQSKG